MLKKAILFTFVLITSPLLVFSQVTLDYYLPEDVSYNPSIPTPIQVVVHEVGEWHTTHDKLVQFMYALAEASDRVTIEEYARSYENRPLVLLTITSEANRSEEHTSELQSRGQLVCRLLLEKKKKRISAI